ncbi:hypothetical protein BGX28_001155 [Mortierella sp. GBA30]|nr:hypothetical protein BGX28_001155 [Mortierella sp. GBA30]
MRFVITASFLALATIVLSDPWKPLGGDLAIVGPPFNAAFKVGDTIPLEYTFYSIKMVNSTTGGTNNSQPIMGTATVTSLLWAFNADNKTVEVALDNGRADGYSATCLATDPCQGVYHPKRINLVIPSETTPGSNYTILFGYTLSSGTNKTLYYKSPVTIVPSSANITSPSAVIQGSPSVQATLPVLAVPKNSGISIHVSKVVVGMSLIASAFLLF